MLDVSANTDQRIGHDGCAVEPNKTAQGAHLRIRPAGRPLHRLSNCHRDALKPREEFYFGSSTTDNQVVVLMATDQE